MTIVHEARGLDVNPQTIEKFKIAKDDESVRILTIIHNDEVTHVGAGHYWFNELSSETNKIALFQNFVKKYFHGNLKPPFNEQDRLKAGLSQDWYIPLSDWK